MTTAPATPTRTWSDRVAAAPDATALTGLRYYLYDRLDSLTADQRRLAFSRLKARATALGLYWLVNGNRGKGEYRLMPKHLTKTA